MIPPDYISEWPASAPWQQISQVSRTKSLHHASQYLSEMPLLLDIKNIVILVA